MSCPRPWPARSRPAAQATAQATPQETAKAGTPTPEVKTSKLSRVKDGINAIGPLAGAFAAVPGIVNATEDDSTARYAERFGVSEPTGDGSLWDIAKFTGLRAGGFATDLGSTLTGGLADLLYRDKQRVDWGDAGGLAGAVAGSSGVDLALKLGGKLPKVGGLFRAIEKSKWLKGGAKAGAGLAGYGAGESIGDEYTEQDAFSKKQGLPDPRDEAAAAEAAAKQGIPAEAQAGTDAGNEDPSTTPEAQVNKYDVLGNEGLRRKDLNAKTYKEGDQVNFGSFGGVTDGGITGTADANGRMNSFTGRGLQQPQQGGLGGMFGSQSPYASSGNPGGVSDAELAIGRFGRANAIRQQTLDEEAERSGGGRVTVVADPNYKPSLSEMYANKLQASRDKAFGVAQMQADATRDAARIRADGAERAGLARAGGGKQADPYKQYSSMIDAQRKAAEYEEFMANRGLRNRTDQFKQSASELENANAVKTYTQDVITDAYASSNNNAEIPPERLRAIYAGMKSAKGIPVGIGPDGKEIMMRVNELDPLSSDFHDAATKAVHFDNAKNVFRDFLQEHGLKASAVDEPGFFERLSVNTKGGGINQNVVFGVKPYSVAERTMNRLFGSGNSVTLQGANRGKNVDMMYDDLMERMDAAGATDYFKEVLGQ